MYDFAFKFKVFISALLSFVLAFVLIMLPLPKWLAWLNPNWIVLVLLYWVIEMPMAIGMFTALFISLFLDVFYNLPLGSSAVMFIIIIYFINRLQVRIKFFPFWQKMLLIFSFILMYQIYFYILQLFFGQINNFWKFLPPTVTSILIWPYLSILLRNYQRLLKIQS